MTQKKCIAVAGCGHWGKNLVRNFSELGALYAVCDNNPEVANAFADKYSVSSLSWDETLDSENVRGVVLASPAPFHYEMAKAALLAGKDVYVEKPITLKNEHAQELCDLAEQNNAVLMVGHLLQYHPAFLKLKSICDEGVLGNLLYIYSNRLSLCQQYW